VKHSVQIDGVTLTRTQLENALVEINKQVEPTIAHFQRVYCGSHEGIVIVGPAQRRYLRGLQQEGKTWISGEYTVIGVSGSCYTYASVAALLRTWSIV
jgi:hypothetical protein